MQCTCRLVSCSCWLLQEIIEGVANTIRLTNPKTGAGLQGACSYPVQWITGIRGIGGTFGEHFAHLFGGFSGSGALLRSWAPYRWTPPDPQRGLSPHAADRVPVRWSKRTVHAVTVRPGPMAGIHWITCTAANLQANLQ